MKFIKLQVSLFDWIWWIWFWIYTIQKSENNQINNIIRIIHELSSQSNKEWQNTLTYKWRCLGKLGSRHWQHVKLCLFSSYSESKSIWIVSMISNKVVLSIVKQLLPQQDLQRSVIEFKTGFQTDVYKGWAQRIPDSVCTNYNL